MYLRNLGILLLMKLNFWHENCHLTARIFNFIDNVYGWLIISSFDEMQTFSNETSFANITIIDDIEFEGIQMII